MNDKINISLPLSLFLSGKERPSDLKCPSVSDNFDSTLGSMEGSINVSTSTRGDMNHDQLLQEVDHYLHVSKKIQLNEQMFTTYILIVFSFLLKVASSILKMFLLNRALSIIVLSWLQLGYHDEALTSKEFILSRNPYTSLGILRGEWQL